MYNYRNTRSDNAYVKRNACFVLLLPCVQCRASKHHQHKIIITNKINFHVLGIVNRRHTKKIFNFLNHRAASLHINIIS